MPDVAAVGIAFLAGILSFLSPCVLPLIPGYLSFMTGVSTAELGDDEKRGRILTSAIMFVIGFSLVFVSLGATASVLGRALVDYRDVLEKIGGVVVIGFGVLMLGIIRVPWLYGESRIDLERSRRFGRGAAVAMGAAFAAGWTPCVGPILGTILTMAASTADVGRGALLLVFYSLGLGVPFVLVAVLFSRLTGVMRWLNRHSLIINRIAGVLLIGVGLLIATGQLGALAAWTVRVIPAIDVQLPSLGT